MTARSRHALRRRERLAAFYRACGETKTDALLKAGYSPATARARQKDFFERPIMREAVLDALALLGVTPEVLAGAIAAGLGADAKNCPRTIRHRYLELALGAHELSSRRMPAAK